MRSADSGAVAPRRSVPGGNGRAATGSAADSTAVAGAARGPGLKDVAAVAGVSHQTVSRVLNTPARVRGETRTRVLTAIEELGYRPNSAARALVTGRSRRLGVVISNGTLYGPSSVLHGVEQAAREANFFMSAVSLRAPTWPALREAVGHLADQGVEGVVLTTPLPGTGLLGTMGQVPVVSVERDTGGVGARIDNDQFGGATAATAHLLGLGHRTVWHLAGPADWGAATDRLAGWRAALAAAGAVAPPPLTGDWSARSGFEAGQMLAADPRVSAVFAGNDQMAIGLLRALQERGRRVPADVSVVGFDDIPEAAYLSPPLTTVRQDFTELGRRCLRLLIAQIESGPDTGEQLLLSTELVVRSSTAPPPLPHG